jgi:hypothetical protein
MKHNPCTDYRPASVRDRQAIRDLDALSWGPRGVEPLWVSALAFCSVGVLIAAIVLAVQVWA